MIGFDAEYFDGRTSARHPVRCDALGMELRIAGPGVLRVVPLAQIEPEAPVGDGPCVLTLPGDGQLRTHDSAAVEALFPRAHALERLVHRIEGHWPAALASVVAVALFSWWVVVGGLPWAAEFGASQVPKDLEAKLGAHTFASLDGKLCKPSGLDAARQDVLQKRFAALTAGRAEGYAYTLHLRDCPGIGPNAFALPGGTIVMTDALVTLAQKDDEISAVLAHEVGHVERQHGLRLSLQAAGVAALTAALFGDAVSITSLATTLPAVLMQSGYSRGLESEADEFAFVRLKEVGISPAAFADMMERLDRRPKAANGADYFSTHPSTSKRVERAREAAR